MQRRTEVHVQPIEGASNRMPHVDVVGYESKWLLGHAYSSGFEDWQTPTIARSVPARSAQLLHANHD